VNTIPLKNNESRFGLIAIILHWVMALIMIGMLTVGLYMAGLPNSDQKFKLFGLHKSFGIVVLSLAALRLFWRLINITPTLSSPWWERLAAHAMHLALYGFMFAMPLSGWLMSSSGGYPVSFFGLFELPQIIAANEEWNKFFQEAHEYLGYALIAAIVLHTAAALKHHFIDKDNILRRMIS
jgi:cytochrome b561